MPEKNQENSKGGEPEQNQGAYQYRVQKFGTAGVSYQSQKGKIKHKPLQGYRPEASGDDSDGEPVPPGDE